MLIRDQVKEGNEMLFSREVAMVYYMNENWTKNDGGELFDMESGKR